MDVSSSLLRLKQGVTKYGPAPHKPILILAILDLIESGQIDDNWIEISGELVTAFQDRWNELVKTAHSPTFALPFYHLTNESGGWWQLMYITGKEVPLTKSKSIKSYKALSETVKAARLDNNLYRAFNNSIQRDQIRISILEKYFPALKTIISVPQKKYSEQINEEILWEPSVNYARKVQNKIEKLDPLLREQEIIIRSTAFKKAVRAIYDNHCAISKMNVYFKPQINMIDACHIIPFAESFDDTIRNGIALSPTLHRAFDRGLISISDDYTVIVHKQVKDINTKVGLSQFDSEMIFLPKDERFYPELSYLKEHRKRFGF